MKKIYLFAIVLLMLCAVGCSQKETIDCINCGNQNPFDSKFCSMCGATLPQIGEEATISYAKSEANETSIEENCAISYIEIYKEPNKMNYSVNDNVFDCTGMEIIVVYESGKTEIITTGYSYYPIELSYDEDVVEISFQDKITYLVTDFLDDRTVFVIPDIHELPLDEAEKKLRNAKVPYELIYGDANLEYDDIAPDPYVSGFGGYHWNEDENYNYIYDNEILNVYVNAPSIYITSVDHDINSVGGVDIRIDVVNNSDKVIKYIKFNNVEFYNTVGDPAYCDIKDTYIRTLSYTGPLNAGEAQNIYWEAVMYNSKTSALVFRTITVDFMDGTSQTINYDAYWWDNRYVGGYPG